MLGWLKKYHIDPHRRLYLVHQGFAQKSSGLMTLGDKIK